MMARCIVYTTHAGGVALCQPSREIFSVMSAGGYWSRRPPGFLDRQIELQIAGGIEPAHASRFARAVAFGGIPTAGVWDIIKDRDCARHGSLHDLIYVDELPDRWFRDAWRRSANGGPVGVDIKKARPIHWLKILDAVTRENERRARDLFGPPEIRLNIMTWQRHIKNARDEDELRKVWPPCLSHLQA